MSLVLAGPTGDQHSQSQLKPPHISTCVIIIAYGSCVCSMLGSPTGGHVCMISVKTCHA